MTSSGINPDQYAELSTTGIGDNPLGFGLPGAAEAAADPLPTGGEGSPPGVYVPEAAVGQPDGVASLDDTGNVPSDQLANAGGGGTQTATLSYGGGDPATFEVFSAPAGWAASPSGTATVGLFLELATNIPSGVLLGTNGNPLPDGFRFPAFCFVEGTIIYDIIAVNPFTGDSQGGIMGWWSDGSTPVSATGIQMVDNSIEITTPPASLNGLSIIDNGSGGITIQANGNSAGITIYNGSNAGQIKLVGLPQSDPAVLNAVYISGGPSGPLMISGG